MASSAHSPLPPPRGSPLPSRSHCPLAPPPRPHKAAPSLVPEAGCPLLRPHCLLLSGGLLDPPRLCGPRCSPPPSPICGLLWGDLHILPPWPQSLSSGVLGLGSIGSSPLRWPPQGRMIALCPELSLVLHISQPTLGEGRWGLAPLLSIPAKPSLTWVPRGLEGISRCQPASSLSAVARDKWVLVRWWQEPRGGDFGLLLPPVLKNQPPGSFAVASPQSPRSPIEFRISPGGHVLQPPLCSYCGVLHPWWKFLNPLCYGLNYFLFLSSYL